MVKAPPVWFATAVVGLLVGGCRSSAPLTIDRAGLQRDFGAHDAPGTYWLYYGSEGGHHYLERIDPGFTVPPSGTSPARFRISDNELPISQPFPFAGYDDAQRAKRFRAKRIFNQWTPAGSRLSIEGPPE
ncbi:MAG TPA: hypothetical protein VF796_07935 [Humisphaera sp.]